MRFRDQSHIDQVREALWRRNGCASVMIGSGFSRNAQNIRPDAQELPTWREVGRAIHDKLYQQEDCSSLGEDIVQTPGADNILRLAQEYKASFGRPDLNRFLRQLIRDEDYKPACAHLRLLRLPWRNIFTTNWDTLLERASNSVAQYNYSIVRTMNEIPLAFEKRIVKLHGSLPDYFPLIVTEEDYRTYPAKFAPFVNTVQQAMMETVFCLIGFSGDDPNFLRWSGWVRDNLGDAAPKIYLAGWLGLSTHRRRMLEDHNVVPIDLAHHPQANTWQDHLRHGLAMDWILYTLERGRPYDMIDWPAVRTWEHEPIPDQLEPIVKLDLAEPKSEALTLPTEKSKNSSDSVREILDAWSHNRRCYPGWLIAPASVRHVMSSNTDEWEPHVLDVSDFAPLKRLNAIYELVWRREILLDPISPRLESAAVNALKPIDCQSRTIDEAEDQTIDWVTVGKAWRTVALALVTAARLRFDHDLFKERIDDLSSYFRNDPDVSQRVHHERCLWALYSMDFNALESLLNDWRTEDCDPAWMLRKALFFFEVNRIDEASKLFDRCLSAIRRIREEEDDLAGPSREGWALWMKRALEWRRWPRREDEDPPSDEPFRRRWRKLAVLKCSALDEREQFINDMKERVQESGAPPFDLGVRTHPGLVFSNETDNRWFAARRAVRLCETAGLPNFGSGVLQPAIIHLFKTEPELALCLVLRALDYDEDPVLKRVLSRTNIARLDAETANRLSEMCVKSTDYARPRLFRAGKCPRDIFWIERMRVAMEVLSRLTLRLSPSKVERTFDQALEYYRDHQVAQELWLMGPVRNLLNRSWEALPQDRRQDRVLDVLGAPLLGLGKFTSDWQKFPTPEELLDIELRPPDRTNDNEVRWQEIVKLILRGLLAGGVARKRASRRLASVAFWNRLDPTEVAEISDALWNEQYTPADGLPGETELFDWVFLLLPEPTQGLAEHNFRRKWLVVSGLSRDERPSLDDTIWQVGIAIAGLKAHGYSFTLSDEEQSYLIRLVGEWSTRLVPPRFYLSIETEHSKSTRQAVDGLRTVLSEVKIPEATAEKLSKKVLKLNADRIPAFGLTAGLVRAMPDRIDDIAHAMRTGLASQDELLANNAAAGLYHWLTTSAEVVSKVQRPPNDLVREIGIMIAARRKGPLSQALQIAKWVFDEGNDEQKEDIRQLALDGLGYLLEELRYDREHDQDDKIDIPLLRWRSAQLALSMAKHGYRDDSTISRWLEVSGEDPLPEVRYVKDPPYFRGPDSKERDGHDEEGTGSLDE